MKNRIWFCLVWLIAGCMPETNPSDNWEGTYIGYYHHNHQDTTPVTLTFEGRYFAAAPRKNPGNHPSSGVFSHKETSLIFYNPEADSSTIFQGTYQYQYSLDGTVRIWQENDNRLVEMFLKQQ
jgi:hypothetical protein